MRGSVGAARLVVLMAAMEACGGGLARAQDISELYRTQAIVTGTGEVNRQIGFEECLRDVLVKVSGDQRVLREPLLKASLLRAGGFVASFRYRDRLEGIPIHDEQGTHDRPHDLYCTFDRGKVDAFLRQVGHEPFLGERPDLLLFLTVRTATGKEFVLTRDGDESPYMRESLLAAAEPLAMSVDVPRRADVAEESGRPAESANGEEPGSVEKAMSGNLTWSDAERGWIAEWRLDWNGDSHRWAIRGVSFDDAFRNAMSGALQIVSGSGPPE